MRLTEALSCGPHELEKFDLSVCGITSDFIGKICEHIVQINGIVELNLGGNSIGDEVFSFSFQRLILFPLLHLN